MCLQTFLHYHGTIRHTVTVSNPLAPCSEIERKRTGASGKETQLSWPFPDPQRLFFYFNWRSSVFLTTNFREPRLRTVLDAGANVICSLRLPGAGLCWGRRTRWIRWWTRSRAGCACCWSLARTSKCCCSRWCSSILLRLRQQRRQCGSREETTDGYLLFSNSKS